MSFLHGYSGGIQRVRKPTFFWYCFSLSLWILSWRIVLSCCDTLCPALCVLPITCCVVTDDARIRQRLKGMNGINAFYYQVSSRLTCWKTICSKMINSDDSFAEDHQNKDVSMPFQHWFASRVDTPAFCKVNRSLTHLALEWMIQDRFSSILWNQFAVHRVMSMRVNSKAG